MKWYNYMKYNREINEIYSLLKEKENWRLKAKKNLCWLRNFNIQEYNGLEYVCISWSGALVQLVAMCAAGQEEGFILN